jgi:hypothetical protein
MPQGTGRFLRSLDWIRGLERQMLILLIASLLIFGIVPTLTYVHAQGVTHLPSSADQKSLAISILEHVGGINASEATIKSWGDSWAPLADSRNTESIASLIIGENNRNLLFTFYFMDSTFQFYGMDMGSVELSGNETLNDSLSIAMRAIEGYKELFNATYCDEFERMISTALQNQSLTVESNDALLEISHVKNCTTQRDYMWTTNLTFFRKISGQYVTLCQAMEMSIAKNGRVTSITDNLAAFHLATADIRVSKSDAVNISMPDAQAFGAKYGLGVFMENVTLDWIPDTNSQRGDSLAVYPVWNVQLMYNETFEGMYGYQVTVWADNGQLVSEGPLGFLGEPQTSAITNYASYLWSMLAIAAAVLFGTFSGTYLKRRNRIQRYAKTVYQ